MFTGPCPECGQTVTSTAKACPKCGNTDFSVPIGEPFWEICRHCKGTGQAAPNPRGRPGPAVCGSCDGAGTARYQIYEDVRTGEESRAIVHPKLGPLR